MTNEEMLRKLAAGELPCAVLPDGRLCIVPQETLRTTADDVGGFVEVVDNTVVAVWGESDIIWVLPRRPRETA